MKEFNGIIVINKEEDMTSFDVVRKVKKILACKKVGHTGTLDPMATGVLPICIGKATKAANYLIKDNKAYIAEVKLGEVTDTYDREGTIVSTNNVNTSEEKLTKVIKSFVGKIIQVPPKYSALKINGQKMYDLARKGIEFEVKGREIEVFSIEILNINLPYFTIRVTCSKGTYIRSLAYDIGQKLGCGAHLFNLQRIKSGNFNIDQSLKLEALNLENIESILISVEELFKDFNSFTIEPYFEKLFLNGVSIKDNRLISKFMEKGLFKVYNDSGKFLGLGKREQDFFKMESLF